MKDAEIKEKFIELRAQEHSFDKIAEELKVGRQTLINWNRELADEIANLKSMRLEALREQYLLSVEAKLKKWGDLAKRITQELSNRQLDDVSTDKLLDMLMKIETKIESIYVEPNVLTEAEIAREKRRKEAFANLPDLLS